MKIYKLKTSYASNMSLVTILFVIGYTREVWCAQLLQSIDKWVCRLILMGMSSTKPQALTIHQKIFPTASLLMWGRGQKWSLGHIGSGLKWCWIKLCAKYLKEGPNLEFGPSLREILIRSLLACCAWEPNFFILESWVKLLGPPHAIPSF